MASESSQERLRRIAAQRAVEALAPAIKRMVAEVTRQHEIALNAAKLITPQHLEAAKRASEALAGSRPVGHLHIDYQSLFPDYAKLADQSLRQLEPAIRAIEQLHRQQFVGVIARARQAAQNLLPPNWWEAGVSIPADLEALLLDEGLPLAWVPPPDVLVKVFAKTSPAERRQVLGSAWKKVGRACVVQLDAVTDPRLTADVGFAQEAAQCLLEGRHRASQALSANLLDSILRREFSKQDRAAITGQKQRLDLDDYAPRVAIVLGGIWGSHGEYWPDKGDLIPRFFSRHGSAHGVSRRQYSRINALLALMHITALIRMLETDF